MWLRITPTCRLLKIPANTLYMMKTRDMKYGRKDRFKFIDKFWHCNVEAIKKDPFMLDINGQVQEKHRINKKEVIQKYNKKLQKYWEKVYE